MRTAVYPVRWLVWLIVTVRPVFHTLLNRSGLPTEFEQRWIYWTYHYTLNPYIYIDFIVGKNTKSSQNFSKGEYLQAKVTHTPTLVNLQTTQMHKLNIHTQKQNSKHTKKHLLHINRMQGTLLWRNQLQKKKEWIVFAVKL